MLGSRSCEADFNISNGRFYLQYAVSMFAEVHFLFVPMLAPEYSDNMLLVPNAFIPHSLDDNSNSTMHSQKFALFTLYGTTSVPS